jgi:predicted transcriptional regulator
LTKEKTLVSVLKAISDKESLDLLSLVASEGGTSVDLRGKINLTRKQYYSRLYRLSQSGIICRVGDRYSLTAFGRIVYNSKIIIDNAIENYWKIKAIDSLEVSHELPKNEQDKLVEMLIHDQEVKKLLAVPS